MAWGTSFPKMKGLMTMDTTKLTRLPPDFRYHASDLKKPCNMPMLFRARYPEIHPPGTLKTLGGTAGHTVMELWLLKKPILGRDGNLIDLGPDADLQQAWFAALCEAADADTAKSKKVWPDEVLENYAAESATDYAAQIRGFMQWWTAGGFELVFVEANYELEIEGGSKETAPYLVEGRIDLCFRTQTGQLVLADWKFGKLEKQHNQDQVSLDMHYQLATYALGMQQGKVTALDPHGNTITLTGLTVDYAGLILMDDFKPYEKKTTISFPTYATDARREWLEERRVAALERAGETEQELREMVATREADAAAFPNNKQKQQAAETGRRKLAEHIANPVLYHEVGQARGPGFHWTRFSPAVLEAHRLEVRGRAASTRMGIGLYRVRTGGCTFCFWKNVCLKDWRGEAIDVNDKNLWEIPEEDLQPEVSYGKE